MRLRSEVRERLSADRWISGRMDGQDVIGGGDGRTCDYCWTVDLREESTVENAIGGLETGNAIAIGGRDAIEC